MTHRKSVPQCILHQVEDIWRKPPFIQGAHDPCDLLGNFPMCNTVWAPGPAWNPNQKKKSGWSQRGQQKSGFKGMFVCNLAAMRPSREAGNLKERKTFPIGLQQLQKESFPRGDHSFSASSPVLQNSTAFPVSPHFSQEERGGLIHCGLAPFIGNVCAPVDHPNSTTFPEVWFHHAGPED